LSLYRQPARARASVLVAVAVVALLVGGGIGFALGRSSAPDPSAGEVVDQLADELRPAINGVQLLPTEYPQAARGSGNEAAAVAGAMKRIRSALDDARGDLVVLDPDGARELERRVATLAAAVEAKAPPQRVQQLAQATANALARVPGGQGS